MSAKVWAWVKKWGGWVGAGILAVLGIFAILFRPRAPSLPSSRPDFGEDPEEVTVPTIRADLTSNPLATYEDEKVESKPSVDAILHSLNTRHK